MSTPVVSSASGQFSTSPFIVGQAGTGAPYTSILAAVTAASSFSSFATVIVQPGTYTESIVWPANIAVLGSANAGDAALLVNKTIINGAQTFTANGSLSFENIVFAGNGPLWTFGPSGSGANGLVQFTNCAIQPTTGVAISAASSFQQANVVLTNTAVASTSADAISLGANGRLSSTLSTIVSTGGNSVTLGNATSYVFSMSSSYQAANAVFNYAGAGSVTSQYDSLDASGTYVVAGASGGFNYSFATLIGSVSIASGITTNAFSSLSSSVTWGTLSANTTVQAQIGYLVTGSPQITLPTTSFVGDLFKVVNIGTGAFTIKQNAGQQIGFGVKQTSSGTGGSVAAFAQGDSAELVCDTANTHWTIISSVGNIIIN